MRAHILICPSLTCSIHRDHGKERIQESTFWWCVQFVYSFWAADRFCSNVVSSVCSALPAGQVPLKRVWQAGSVLLEHHTACQKPDTPSHSSCFAVLLVVAKSRESATWMTVVSLFVGWLQLMSFSLSSARVWRADSVGTPESKTFLPKLANLRWQQSRST